MRVLVTGGAGFIGSHLTEGLIRKGAEVVVFDDLSSGKLENLENVKNKIELIKGDVRNFGQVLDAMDGIAVVYHLAAIVSVSLSMRRPKLVHDVNVNGTANVLEAARMKNVKKFIFTSSAAVYGNNQNLPLKEEYECRPLNPYAASKVEAEKLCLKYGKECGIKTSVLRIFNVYGPRQDPNSPYSGVITRFANAVKMGEAVVIYGDGNQTRDFIHVKDVVEAAIDPPGGIFNVGTGTAVKIIDIVRILEKATERGIKINFEKERKGDIKHSLADITKLKNRPKIDLTTGLKALLSD